MEETKMARKPKSSKGRRRPNLEALGGSLKHGRQHKGEMGRFNDCFIETVTKWKVSEGTHDIMIPSFHIDNPEESPFRFKGNKLNMYWKESILDANDAWDYRLTILLHTNMGVNKDAIICLRTIGEKCPICELRAKYDEKSQEYKALAPTRRTLYNIVVLDSDTEKDSTLR